MSTFQRVPDSHDEAFELIPWLVNGRLPPDERERVERHLVNCDDCRREVDEQQQLRRAVRRDESNIEYAPHASFQKLWQRIERSPLGDESDDDVDHGHRGDHGDHGDRGARSADSGDHGDRGAWSADLPSPERRTWDRSRRWMMAAGTVMALGLGLLVANEWQALSPDRAPAYTTASVPPALPDRDGQIRVVFAPNVTVDELTRIVGETRLTIVGGPSDSGVYTLAVQPGLDLPVANAIERLRSDPRVRFAEPVVAGSRVSP